MAGSEPNTGAVTPARYDAATLANVALAIIAAANKPPMQMKREDYDAAIADSPYPDAPNAKDTCDRLGLGWKQLRRVAASRPVNPASTDPHVATPREALGHAPATLPDRLELPEVDRAVVMIAHLLGIDYLGQLDYVAGRDKYLRSHKGPRRQEVPTLARVKYGATAQGLTWEDVLCRNGLAKVATGRGVRGVAVEDALHMFVDFWSCCPSLELLREWAVARNLSLRLPTLKFADHVDNVQASRVAMGLPAADRCPVRLDFATVDPLVAGHRNARTDRPRGMDPLQSVLPGLLLALDGLKAGERFNSTTLNVLAKDRPGSIPSYRVVTDAGWQMGLHKPFQRLWKHAAAVRAARDTERRDPVLQRTRDDFSEADIRRRLKTFTAGMTRWPKDEEWVGQDGRRLRLAASLRGADVWATELGLEIRQASSPEVIQRELERYLVDKDHWPSTGEFEEDGRRQLLMAIYRDAGTAVWAERFGLEPVGRERKWTDERIEQELRPLIEELRAWPTTDDFKDRDLGGLYQAIAKQSAGAKGAAYWAERMGVEAPNLEVVRTPKSVENWTPELIESRLAQYLERKDHWPKRTEFKAAGLGGLLQKIARSPGGIPKWAVQFGFEVPPQCVARQSWTDEAIEHTLAPLIREDGQFPTKKQMTDAGLAALYEKIRRRPEGLDGWAARMGTARPNRNSWSPEAVVEGLVLALPQLRQGERLGQRTLRRITNESEHPAIPTVANVTSAGKEHGVTPAEFYKRAYVAAGWSPPPPKRGGRPRNRSSGS